MLRSEYKTFVGQASDHKIYSLLKSLFSAQYLGLSYSEWKLDYLADECHRRNKEFLYTSAIEDATFITDKISRGYSALYVDEIIRPELLTQEESREIVAETTAKDIDIRSITGVEADRMFLCKVSGESMTEDDIHDGDILIVDRKETAVDGKVIVAELENVLFVKRLRLIGDETWLYSGNPDFAHVRIEDKEKLKIIGVVKMTMHTIK